jgi:two-component sensor histidine kinase
MVVVDPARLGRLPPPPPPTIDEVLVDGRPASGPGLVADADSFRFEFHYSAPYVSDPRRVRFRYRLDDVDDDWVDAGAARVAHYSNLPPGPMRFRVMAGNEEDLWNGSEASYELRRRPYFRQTPWFYALCALGVFLLAWAVHRYRVRRLLDVERVRMRIASDLHDDIGASLSQIAIFSEVARSRVAAGDQGEALLTLERMGNLSRESVDAMGDIVWALDPRKDRLVHLTQRLRALAAEVLTPAGIGFSFEAEDAARDLSLGADIRRELFLVFKESLHNVVRHSGAGRTTLAVRREDGQLVLRVSDDGRGFDPVARRDGNGLGSMRRRAEAIGGRLDVVSASGQGTTVTLTAPLSRRSRHRGEPRAM